MSVLPPSDPASACVVFGVGSSYLRDVDETIFRLGWRVQAYISNDDGKPPVTGLTPWLSVEELDSSLLSLPAIVAVATPEQRANAVQAAREVGFTRFPPLVDPTSVLARSTRVDDGAMVNAGAVLAPGVHLGPFSVVNRSASIGHDSSIGELSFIGPGAVLSGNVRLSERCFVGSGTTILPGVRVGRNARIGAGAVVIGDVEEEALVIGNPARPVT